ncbi:MAG TPA: sigma-70 family RNA polymerase sigma factor [Rudaea sp.]|nr:sigma-70 family RNA polymerase sigma factor [Rudaea sp.]
MSRFNTTQWSVVLGAQGTGDDARAALESLCRTYRPPVLAYISSRGYRSDVAEDLTQSFFARFLERGGYAEADPSRGRFRAYLLTAIKNFLINTAAEAHTVKRGGRIQFESIDNKGADGDSLPDDGSNPEQVFEQAWALVVLDSALRRLRKEAQLAGKGALFDHLRDFLAEQPDEADYARVAAALSLRRNTVAVSVHRLRQRLRELVREQVAQTAADHDAFEIELRELRGALGNAMH